MSQPPDHPSPPPPPEDAPAPAPIHSPVQRSTSKPIAPIDADERRDFFSDAMREILAPVAGLLERRINPFLAALESLPTDVERFTQTPISLPVVGTILDQPSPKSYLPASEPAPAPPRFLRPPGAVAPDQFETLCTRCGRCAEVCPANAIRLDSYAFAADGRPAIIPAEQPCVVCDSLACMNNCPTGALKLVDKFHIKMGTAKVDRDLCRRETGEDCRLCVEACPINGDTANGGGTEAAIFIHAETGRIRVRKNVCIGCGLCESRCPTSPAAIIIEPFRPPLDPIIA